jgi:hypothetical protein
MIVVTLHAHTAQYFTTSLFGTMQCHVQALRLNPNADQILSLHHQDQVHASGKATAAAVKVQAF